MKFLWLFYVFVLLLGACGGGSEIRDGSAGESDCDGACANQFVRLTVEDVNFVLSHAIQQANAQGVNATIAVVDRVGNVLAVYRMGEAERRSLLIATETNPDGIPFVQTGLEGIALPTPGVPLNIDHLAAITKAITGAYLSSEGNAFSTRTANQIVQENFNPGELNQPAGPLFGVQFSQFSCSDFTNDDPQLSFGPKRSPLGLAADPGGFPLYKQGTVVGGVGVISDGFYSIDKTISDKDVDLDELIALAATLGFEAPLNRRADRITVEGKTFRFSDASYSELFEVDNMQSPIEVIENPANGSLIDVTGYFNGVVREGLAFGTSESGIRQEIFDFPEELGAFVFVDSNTNQNRFPAIDGSDGLLLQNEVSEVMLQAMLVANRSRAQIRRPLGSHARVTISVVDTNGAVLGMVRSRDAPVFGADVSLQKARTATFFSSATAAGFLESQPDAVYFDIAQDSFALVERERISIASYLESLRVFLNNDAALSSGEFAFSDRAGGNLSRPFYPDGIEGLTHGPLSKPSGEWSVFSTGLQLDLVLNGVIQHILHAASDGAIEDNVNQCTGVNFIPEDLDFSQESLSTQLANGPQIFPGSVPIYKGNTLVGGIGVSGDGVDQDDMIAFLAVHNAAIELGGTINNAPSNMRADNLSPEGVRLRYIQCPQAPFLDDTVDNVCEGK